MGRSVAAKMISLPTNSCVFFKLFDMAIYYIILSACYLPFFFENDSLSNHLLQYQSLLSQLNHS